MSRELTTSEERGTIISFNGNKAKIIGTCMGGFVVEREDKTQAMLPFKNVGRWMVEE